METSGELELPQTQCPKKLRGVSAAQAPEASGCGSWGSRGGAALDINSGVIQVCLSCSFMPSSALFSYPTRPIQPGGLMVPRDAHRHVARGMPPPAPPTVEDPYISSFIVYPSSTVE